MKIIHTFLPVNNEFNKETALQMALSCLLAKRHYNYVFLYTNKKIAEKVKQLGIPYNVIDTEVLEGMESKTFSIPKLAVYAVQKEPYIHIDLDTFLFNRIEFDKVHYIYSTFAEGSKYMINFEDPDKGFYETYMKNSFLLQPKLPMDFVMHVSFKNIPNMSVFGGFEWELIAEASRYCLDLYKEHKDFFDSSFYNACIIEQLFIPSAIRKIIHEKGLDRGEKQDPEFNFLFKENPTIIDFGDKELMTYPYIIKSNSEEWTIKNDQELFDSIGYRFNGFLHLSGYKVLDRILFLIREKLIYEENGIYILNKITLMFDENGVDKLSDHYYNYLDKRLVSLRNIRSQKGISII
jgi:hypothetical protein